ncbi:MULTISPECIES: YceI family protein [Actinosynnema]|uniref:Lipid/polyisoprenoid-binding YceI-like domain-containing protein n=1 Tax=Actinosynnema pretiosum TaxID=42197 RepID=A0A290Z496_9PSEU|nr:YceI family protein [Actinosynnema pretiosum]ATE53850.1 hypothetical protein CNX65_11560 [Actinosynnema pretiosum]
MTSTQIPGYLTGSWAIDPVHSDVSFTVRHLGISKVRGHFGAFEGSVVTAENPLESTVTATIDATTVDTRNADRDGHLQSPDFLDTANHPKITFTSTALRAEGEEYFIDGELTLRGVTKPVTLEVEVNGFGDGMSEGSKVAGFTATTSISRKDFGVTGGAAGAVVSDKIEIKLEIELAKQA